MEACCADLSNRAVRVMRPTPGGRVVVEVCLVCGRRHYMCHVEPVVFGLRSMPMDKERRDGER